MRVKWSVLATILGVGLGYVAYPYVSLYQLGSAIHRGDAASLEHMVDWPAVREGIKEDICDLSADEPGSKNASELPPFGASFVRGIESRTIDQAVTPQALLAATVTAPNQPPQPPRGADVHVTWAFFDSLTSFQIDLQPPGQVDPIKLEMDLKNGEWRIRRVWLPADLLSSSART
jgi:hypothetical protein